MARDAENRAKQASDRDMALSKQYGATSDTLAGQLTPIYSQMATNPTGMTQSELNDARTGAMQSTGGAVSGATGEGNLIASRTGNAGGYQAALRDAARRGIAQNADASLKVNNLNTTLKEGQRQAGVAGLQGLESENKSGALSAMGLNTGAINAETNAGQSGWFQNFLGTLNALSNAGKSAASLGAHV